jgi:hypothetical protein
MNAKTLLRRAMEEKAEVMQKMREIQHSVRLSPALLFVR